MKKTKITQTLCGILAISTLASFSTGTASARSWDDNSYTANPFNWKPWYKPFAKPYPNYNAPKWFDVKAWHPVHYNYQLSALPTAGKVDPHHIPWADSYWPKQRGAMNYRWKKFQNENMDQNLSTADLDRLFFHNHLYTRDELLTLNRTKPEEIMNLSPTEKYSIFIGDYSYRLVHQWASNMDKNNPDRAYWEGYCHAWAAAALHYPEPQPVTVTNADGITIPFGSADIKALLVANYADGFGKMQRATIGTMCHQKFMYPVTKMRKGKEIMADYADYTDVLEDEIQGRVSTYISDAKRLGLSDLIKGVNPAQAQSYAEQDGSCDDTNAGAFHVVAANQLGIMHEGFAFDKTRDVEVWNQPAYAFESKIIGDVANAPHSAPGTVRTVSVETKLYYAEDTDYGWAFWNPTVTSLFAPDKSFMDEFNRYQKLRMNEGDITVPEVYPASIIDYASYKYTLELDRGGRIIGGEWLTLDRPDYMWIAEKKGFSPDYSALTRLYKPIEIPEGVEPQL